MQPAAAVPVAPPREWQLLDDSLDHVPGISEDRAMRELLARRSPARTVVVAVIDGGVDTAHVDLAADIWTNPREIPGNHIDDDHDGYVDDVHGWDFIGGADGRDVNYDTYEVTRLYGGCTGAPAQPPLPPAMRPQCPQITAVYEKQRAETQQTLNRILAADQLMSRITTVLQGAVAPESVTTARVTALHSTDPTIQQAQHIFLALGAQGITPSVIAEAKTSYEQQSKYSLDLSFNPRSIVGDDYTNLNQRHYGNPDVMGPDASHGTHVAGIIGAVRGNGIGIDGIAPAVRIMSVRAVPNGDERDKDIANAIHFAVDHGANIINMSFGKGYSPYKSAVDAAVKYADAHGVLMVHAAGNDGADEDTHPNFPTPVYLDGGRAQNWIEVGASSWKGGDSLAASFSNYSPDRVDVFAPGVDILSSIPGNKYQRDSGTSMASPVVAGLAALIEDYYPSLTAADVKRIILASAVRHPGQMVVRPGSTTGQMVPFDSLSVTGGIVNAYTALKMAAQESGQRATR